MQRLDMTAAGRIALALCLWVALAGRSGASPYYTVTPIGNLGDIQVGTASLVNTATGLSYSFVNTAGPLTSAESQNLPATYLPVNYQIQGSETFPLVRFGLSATAINNSGTVIGAFPTWSASSPWTTSTQGYTVRSSNGNYSPFVTLVPSSPVGYGQLFLSQSNQILVNDINGTRLLDLNTKIMTPVSQLVPQALLQALQANGGFHGDAIDDRGDLLVDNGRPAYILTPPGLAPPDPIPTATPEPSTLAFFGLIAGSLAVRSALGRRRKRRGRSDVSRDHL